MKKLMSLLLAAAMIMSLGVTALAVGAQTNAPAYYELIEDGEIEFDDLENATKPSAGVEVSGATEKVENVVTEGQIVTVKNELPCKAAYFDGEKYVTIAATENSDGTYSFEAPEGVTEVVLVVNSDVNEDAVVNSADKALLARSLLPSTHNAYQALTAEQAIAVDVNNDGSVNSADKALLARSLLPTSHPAYQALAW